MRRDSLMRLTGLVMSLGLAACAAYQAQQASPGSGGHDHHHAPSVQPGREFTELPADEQIARVRGQVTEVKSRLAQEGRYACCVEPACSECLLRYGECHCREAVRHSGPCCGECTEAWIEGRGTVEGVTAWELLERKKQSLENSGDAPWTGTPADKPKEDQKPPAPDHHQHHH